MKKKISRIQRWLDRLSTACETGRWDSALVEADCLSAEVREIREDLTRKLENANSATTYIFSRSTVAMSIKSVGIALFIVLVSTIPLAVESERPRSAQIASGPVQSSGREMLAWVTREEDELIRTLRADLSGQNAELDKQEKVFSVPAKKRASVRGSNESIVVSEIPALRNMPVRSEAGISAEDLLALVQIGEKALRGDAPAIKVIK
jgi:hypothetical protein